MSTLKTADPEVHAAMAAEFRRQQDDLELIASENYVSRAVIEAAGTVLTNKYAEGLPGKRYYGGCEHVDVIEDIARERAKQLFGAVGVNVQPHSGAQANGAMYLALIKPGDTVLGLNLTHGGHLTHGSAVNSSGLLYKAVHYGVDESTGRIDMDVVRDIARKERPKIIVTGASAYARTLDFAAFRAIADEVGAFLVADIAHIAGLVATGRHPSPIPHCHMVTTTTHKTLRGPRGGMIMTGMQDQVAAMNKAVFPGTQGGPLMHQVAAKAIAFKEALQPEFTTYIDRVLENAKVLAGRLVEHGFKLVSGGTDNHLMLVDLGEECSGKEAEEALGRAGITVNKNTVPGEKRSPFVTSGVRLGTPAMTTRGLTAEDARNVGDWIATAIRQRGDADAIAKVKAEVHATCRKYPVYPEELAP